MSDKLLTYPNRVAGGQRMFWYMKHLNIPYTNDYKDADIRWLMFYTISNKTDQCPSELITLSDKLRVPIINQNLLNIKKDHVDDVFTEVFGYSLRLDPTKHRGICIVKSTQNAIHMGKFIECPISKEEVDTKPRYSGRGEPHYRMYVKMIDTRINKDTIRDFRIAVMGGSIVALFEKHMDSTSFFHAAKDKRFDAYMCHSMNQHFSMDETQKINQFIAKMNIDFAEIDVLRDNSTGLMYIIDVNPVPGGGLLNLIGEQAAKQLAETFKQKHLT